MDPLSALSIAGNVAQFLELGYKVARRLTEYHRASPHDVPRSMQTINTLLPLILRSLDRIKTDVEINKFDIDTKCMIRGIVAGCSKLCEDIESILARVAHIPGDSVALKIRKALGSLKHDDKVAEIGRSLQAYVQVLILYRVVDSKEMPSRPPDKGKYSNVRGKLTADFVRRQNLVSKLDAALADVIAFQQQKPQVVVLSGSSGVGKTQLALDYCLESYQTDRFQTVLWLKASSPEALRSSLEDVAATVRRSNDGSQEAKIDFVMDFLGERWHPWLLVLDEYSPATFGSTDVWTLLPQKGHGGIIVTTRDTFHDGIQIKVTKQKNPDELKALQEQLRKAVKAKNLDEMRNCVENGADVNEKNKEGYHYIIQAADNEFVEGVKYFLEEGADPEPTTAEESVMSKAGYRSQPKIMEAFLDFEDAHGIRSQQRSYDIALEKAANGGCSELCKMLMKRRGVKPGSCFMKPRLLWLRAAHNGYVEFMEFFEEEGLRPKTDDIWLDSIKQTIWKGSTEAVKYIMNIEPEQRKANAHCALSLAVDFRRTDVVRLLLENGCDPNLPDGGGHVPILVAIKQDIEEITRLLLDYGAVPSVDGGEGENTHIRQRGYSSESAAMVLESMAPETPRAKDFIIKMLDKSLDDGGWQLALTAIETAERLGEKQAVLAHVDDDGRTFLAQAIDRYGDLKFTRFFIKQGSDLEVRRKSNGDSILHMAARHGNLGIVQIHLEKALDRYNCDKNTKDKFLSYTNKYGNTPLHLAATNGHTEVMKLLYHYGADRNAENKFGVTPRDMARENGNDTLEIWKS
ncbi:Ankyrin-2 [Loxospora ochrophaea]|nr:Ankyrin-2 [Loxospora ochrophaea]